VKYLWLGLCWVGCSADTLQTDPVDSDTDVGGDMTVTFTTYVDDACTELPPRDSVVVLDPEVTCNETPDSSISELVCFADRITYTNHPNTSDCSADGISNELWIGVCQEFPGPARTWKYIEPDTYDCLTASRR